MSLLVNAFPNDIHLWNAQSMCEQMTYSAEPVEFSVPKKKK